MNKKYIVGYIFSFLIVSVVPVVVFGWFSDWTDLGRAIYCILVLVAPVFFIGFMHDIDRNSIDIDI